MVIPIDRPVVPLNPGKYGAVGTITMLFSLQKVIHRNPENSGALSVWI
jgi:hypothetical protein